MNRKGMLIVAAALLLIWGGQGIIPNYGFAQTGVSVPEMVNVDKVFSNFMNEWNIPGGSIAIVKDGRLVYARGFGYADKESNELVKPHHLFRIASVSKPITSIAIMKLVEDGLIDVDAKVFGTNGILQGSDYSPILDPRVENITVRHLLHHTSGWGSINGSHDPMFSAMHIAREMGVDPPARPVNIIKFMLATQTLNNDPGTKYFYSNFGFCILGRVIEQVSGKSYENYVKTELLNPLGISEMQLGRNLYENKALNEVKYYNFPGAALANSVYGTDERVPWPYGGFNIEAMDSNGGWIASAIDLARLLVAVDGFDTKPDILSQPTIQLMTTPSIENRYYGLGWQVNQWDNWWHNGSLPGASSIFVRISNGLGWVVLFNTRPFYWRDFMQPMHDMVWEAIRGIDSWPTHDLFQHPVSETTSLADIALIIDSSGSMGNPPALSDPNNLRISGAKLFIQLADPKVQIAIVDFDGDAETFAPLTFADDIGKNRLKNAVDRVDADGWTNIDAGLQQGFQELNASTASTKKAAVLLTDGQNIDAQQNVVPIKQHVISDYATKGWPIYTIGLGSGVDRQELERIAQATGGEYFYAAHDSDIQSVYPKILAKTTNKSVVASYKGYINENQVITKDVTVDENIDQMDTSMTWDGSSIELVLIDPDGTQITPQNFNATPGITYKDEPTYAIYTLERPKPGIWQLQATGTDIPTGGEQFNLIVTATSDFATNFLTFDSSYAVGDTIRVGINIKEKIGDTFEAVLGATATAKVVRPDGRIDTLNLYDDGSHNDIAASDGVYANNYPSVDKQGTYLIKVSAENGFSREIQAQVVVGRIDNVLIDTSTLTPAAGATLDQAPNVISAVISGPAGRINHNSVVLKVDGRTVSHTYNRVNQLVSYRPGGLSGGSHHVQLSLQDTSGNAIETTWQFTIGSSVVTTAHPYIYWTNHGKDKIQRSNLDGTDVEDLVTTGLSWPVGIALDVSGGKIYWADSWRDRIQRSNLDGTGVENLVTGLPGPAGIALDVSGGKIYWADERIGRIQRSNLDGTDVEDLVTGLGKAYGIALDVIGGKIYWTGSDTTRKIQRSNLDGTDVEDLVTGLPGTHHIALDVSGGKMYWADIKANKIQRSNLNGTGVEDLVTTGLDGPDGIALDVSNGKIYWSDWGTDKIQRSNLDGTGVEDFVTGIGGAGDIALDVTGGSHDPVVKPRDDHSAHKMYWVDMGKNKGRNRIQRANLDGTQVEDLVTTGLRGAQRIALNTESGKMYWTDFGADKIQRANLDGTQVEDLVTTGLRDPDGIALDIRGGKMYWTDYGTGKIQRANLDGTQVEDLVTTGLRDPDGIALDIRGRKMYWTDRDTDKIQRANLDGTQVEDLVTTGLKVPEDIALDIRGGKMYWIDQGTDKIQRANLDGTQVEDLVTGLNAPLGIALDIRGGKMYWTDRHPSKIQRANLDGTQVEDLVTGLGEPNGIALDLLVSGGPTPSRDVNGRVLFSDDFSSGNLDKWTPRARIGTVENGALKLVGIQGGNYSVDVTKDIFPTENYARYVLSFDWKSTVKETPYGISHVSAYFYDRTGKLIGQMLALNTGFPNRTFEDHGGNLVPGRYGGVFKVHESFDWERVTLDTATAVPRLNVADIHRIHLRAEVYNDAGSGGDLYVDNFSFAGVSGTPRVVREDVNGDGVVDLKDTTVVRANLGQTGQNDADVNGDGVVDVDDLVLVLAAIEAAAGGAPSFQTQVLHLFTVEEGQQWLAEARLSGDTSPAYLRGIAVLEQILALLTPQETLLLANYPNPFNPETWIPYRLAKSAEVTLTIYAVNGQVVRTLDLGHQVAGFYESRSRAAYWDGRNAQGESVASGVYFYTLSTGDFIATRKMLIRK